MTNDEFHKLKTAVKRVSLQPFLILFEKNLPPNLPILGSVSGIDFTHYADDITLFLSGTAFENFYEFIENNSTQCLLHKCIARTLLLTRCQLLRECIGRITHFLRSIAKKICRSKLRQSNYVRSLERIQSNPLVRI